MLCIGPAQAATDLLELHGPDGQTVLINPGQINSLRQPTSVDLRRFFPKSTRCVVLTTDGKFIAVVEVCGAIRDMMTK